MSNYLVFSEVDFDNVLGFKSDGNSKKLHPVAHEIASTLLAKIFEDSSDIFVCQTGTQVAKAALKAAVPLCRFSVNSESEYQWTNYYQPVFESYMELRAVQHTCFEEIAGCIEKLNMDVESVENSDDFEDFDTPSLRNLDKAFNYLDSTFKSDLLEFIIKKFKVKELRIEVDELTEEDYFDVPIYC